MNEHQALANYLAEKISNLHSTYFLPQNREELELFLFEKIEKFSRIRKQFSQIKQLVIYDDYDEFDEFDEKEGDIF